MANVERLLQLRRVVEAAPDDRFHMRTVEEESPCGTARCAIGWCRQDSWFLENTPILDLIAEAPESFNTGRYYLKFREAAKMFGISNKDANNLFGAELNPVSSDPHAVSKAEVIENIDRLLAGDSAEPYEAAADDDDDDDDDDWDEDEY